jgi:hypothetical protein
VHQCKTLKTQKSARSNLWSTYWTEISEHARANTKVTSPVWFHIASKFEVQQNVITELRREGLWWERKGVEKMEGGEGICYDIKPLEGKSLKWQAIWWRLLLAVCTGRKATQTPHHFGVAERPLAMMPSLLLVPPWRSSLFSKLPTQEATVSHTGFHRSYCLRPLSSNNSNTTAQEKDPSRLCKP